MGVIGTGPLGYSTQATGIDAGTRVLTASPLPGTASTVAIATAMAAAVAFRRANAQAAKVAYEARYAPILERLPIDLEANVREALRMSFLEIYSAVRKRGKWDYKKNTALVGKVDEKLLDEFGNFHFGVIAASRGLDLYITVLGAGAYQVCCQPDEKGERTGSMPDLLNALSLSPAFLGMSAGITVLKQNPVIGLSTAPALVSLKNSLARQLISSSDTAVGDNPGDSVSIQKGWEYYFRMQGYAPP